MDEKTKAHLMLQKIKEHFKYHYYFTADDFEQFEREEYQAEMRRGTIELESDIPGMESFDFIDLP